MIIWYYFHNCCFNSFPGIILQKQCVWRVLLSTIRSHGSCLICFFFFLSKCTPCRISSIESYNIVFWKAYQSHKEYFQSCHRMRYKTVILSLIPVPLRRVVHALQQQKSHLLLKRVKHILLPNVWPAGWLSRDKRCFFTRSGRRVLIRLYSVNNCTSQLTSQRACQYCCCIYTDTQKKVRVISFLPSDMMHVHFATRKVTKKQGPKCQFQKDV